LRHRGRFDEAEAEFRRAARLRPDDPERHFVLGVALVDHGRFAQALTALEQAQRLGALAPGWKRPVARAIGGCRRMMSLGAKLTAALEGKARPGGAAERLERALLCQRPRQRHADAVRLFTEAFAEAPGLADNLARQPRFHAACAAVLVSAGRDREARPDEEEK